MRLFYIVWLDFQYLNRIYFFKSAFKNDFETAKPLRVVTTQFQFK